MFAVILWGLFWGLLVLLAALLLILSLPVALEARAERGEVWQGEARVRILGRWGPSFKVSGGTAKARAKRQGKPARKRDGARRKRRGRRGRSVPIGRALSAGPDLIAGLLGKFTIRELEVDARFGLGDPAATGQAYGVLGPAVFGLGWMGSERVSVLLEPDFERLALEGRFSGALAVTPITLLGPVAIFAWRVFGPGQ